MIRIGPYRFTVRDADRTIANYDALWSLLCEGRDTTPIDDLRVELSGDRETDLPRVWESLLAAGPALRAAGQLPVRAEGRVAQLSTSPGGVPKLPVRSIDVGWSGARGDVQSAREHHGRPWQALCIWSTEAIAELNASGHQLTPGAAGENVTVSGLPWPRVRAGVRLQIGEVLCEVSAFALPCRKNARWFAGGDFGAMHHERGPSRVYASVLAPGRITTGDSAVLEP